MMTNRKDYLESVILQNWNPGKLRLWQGVGAFLLCLVFSVSGLARESASATAKQELPDPVTTYLNAIDNAEYESGAYSTQLGDLYLGLGQSWFQQGNYDEAKKAFQRGLQIERVNYGLYGLGQKSYLFSIADIEGITGTWKSTENILDNIYLIISNSYEGGDPESLPALDELLNWYLVNYKVRSSADGYLNLQRAESLAAEMADIVEYNNGLNHPDTIKILRQIGHLHYFMAEHINGQGESINPKRQFNSSSATPGMATRPPVIDELLRSGIINFTKIIESVGLQENSTALQRANSIAQLGDWHLIFGQRQTAGGFYQRAYQLLAASNVTQHLTEEIFGQPTLVDFSDKGGAVSENLIGEEGSETVQVSMTISNSGRPQDITVINPPETMEKQQITRLQRRLRTLAFRPRLADGKPVVTKQFILHYPITEIDEILAL